MLAYGRWLIRKRSVGFGVTWPWWGLRTVFGMANSRKDSIVVGEVEKDVARDAEPVALAAAGLSFVSAGRSRQGREAVRRNSGIPARGFRRAAFARHAQLPAPSPGRGAPLSVAGAQDQFRFRGCDVESRARASCDRSASTRPSRAIAHALRSGAGSSGNSLQSRQCLSRARSHRRSACELRCGAGE